MSTQNNIRPVWFITGASSGFGLALAEYAVQQNYRVVATARRLDRLTTLAESAPEQVLALSLDVTDTNQIEGAASAALEHFGCIDVLFNNAGYGIVGALEETPEQELRQVMETNFFGAWSMTQAILPVLRKQRKGAVVNISSMGGVMSFGGFSAYSASKFALEGASEALAQEMKPFGVDVLIVEPGAFRTEFAGSALKHMPVIEEYDDIVGGTRAFARNMDGTQPGDPAKAAAAIDTALKSDETPLRLQLGEDSVEAVKAHSEHLIIELERWRPVAVSTTFD
ncbi:MAG: oxidoreductase [Bacteroidota bacterium]